MQGGTKCHIVKSDKPLFKDIQKKFIWKKSCYIVKKVETAREKRREGGKEGNPIVPLET